MIVGNLIAKLSLDAKGFRKGITKSRLQLEVLNKRVLDTSLAIKDLTGALALAGGAAFFATKKFADMAIEIQSINRRMEFVTGGGKNLARSWTFLRKAASSLSLSLEDLTSSYGNLAAATRSTGLTTEEVKSLFLAISEAASVFGLSAQRTRLAFLAVEQMASKGVISMQELRRQLGDQLPGALNTMADALGVTTKELNKLVATGQLMSEAVLPLFALQLRVDMAEGVAKLGKGVRSAMADFKTAWFDLKQAVSAHGGIIEGILKLVIDLSRQPLIVATSATNAINKLIESMKTLDQASGLALKGVADLPKETGDKLNKEIKKLEEQLEEGRTRFWQNFGANTEKEIKAWREVVTSNFESVAGEFTTLIVGMATGADVSFRSMLDNMTNKILEFTTNMLVVRPILEWFSAWLKSITAPGGAGASGIFGTLMSAFGANIKPAATVTAMAEGGMINEPVAGIGLKTTAPYLMGESGPEAIIPEDQMGGGGATNVTVNIQAVDSKSITQLLKENPQAVTGPIVNAIKNGDRGFASALKLATG